MQAVALQTVYRLVQITTNTIPLAVAAPTGAAVVMAVQAGMAVPVLSIHIRLAAAAALLLSVIHYIDLSWVAAVAPARPIIVMTTMNTKPAAAAAVAS